MSARSLIATGRVSFADIDSRRDPTRTGHSSQRRCAEEKAIGRTNINPAATGEAHGWWRQHEHPLANSFAHSSGADKISAREGRRRRLSNIASFRNKQDGANAKPANGGLPRTLPPPPLPPKSILIKTHANAQLVKGERLSSTPEDSLTAPPKRETEKPNGLGIRGTRLASTSTIPISNPPSSPRKSSGSPRPAPHIPALPDFTPDLSFLDFDPFPAGLPAALASTVSSSQSQGTGLRNDPGQDATLASKKAARRGRRDSISCKNGTQSIAFVPRPVRTSSRSDLSASGKLSTSTEEKVTPWSQFRPIPEQVPSSPSVSTSSSEEGSSDDTSSELFFNPRSREAVNRPNEQSSTINDSRALTAYILPDLNTPGFELDVRIQRASFVRLSRQAVTTVSTAAERIVAETGPAVSIFRPTVTPDCTEIGGDTRKEGSSVNHCVSLSIRDLEKTESSPKGVALNVEDLTASTSLTPSPGNPGVPNSSDNSQWQVVSQAEYARLVQARRPSHTRTEHNHIEESLHLEALAGRAAALERLLMAGKRVSTWVAAPLPGPPE